MGGEWEGGEAGKRGEEGEKGISPATQRPFLLLSPTFSCTPKVMPRNAAVTGTLHLFFSL